MRALVRSTAISLSAGAVLAVAALSGASPAAHAGGNTSNLTVTARILPYTRVEVVSAPGMLAVDRQDVERGYIDVDTPLQLAVTSNDPRGVLLMLAPMSDYIERADVSGLGGSVLVGRGGGFVQLPSAAPGRQRTAHSLRFRLFLNRNTPAGLHPWPIQVSSQLL